MAEMTRFCPDCGQSCQFGQLHDAQESCPDTADGYCPEWICLVCGAGFLIGLVPVGREADELVPLVA